MIAKLALGAALTLAQCAPAPGCGAPDPGFALRHDFSLSPGIEVGRITSCIDRDSRVSGRDYLCRIIGGYEELDQGGNWHIDAAPSAGRADVVIAAQGSNTSPYGWAIALADGRTFEGCRWISPSNDYDCDYQSSKHVVLEADRTDFFGHALRKLWDWSLTQGNALGCAGGVVSVWYGGVLTLPFLVDCLDGPL
jgi:hypothetical protein